MKRLHQGNFDFVPRARVVEVGKDKVQYVLLESEWIRTAPADTVVFVSNNLSLADVHNRLIGGREGQQPLVVKRIGDALSPRDLQAAIADGHMAGVS